MVKTSTTLTPHAKLLEQATAAFVSAHDTTDIRMPTQSKDVIENVRGPTELKRLGINLDDRHRSLWRDPADLAPNVMIQDQVTDNQDSGLGKPLNMAS